MMKRTLDLTHKDVLKKKICFYSPTKAKKVIENTKNILTTLTETSTGNGCKFVNVFNKSYVITSHVPGQLLLDVNCLAIDCSHSYFTPFYFDVDCVLCKSSSNQHSIEPLNCFVQMKEILHEQFPSVDFEDYEIYKSNTSCGFHVYFHTKTSISIVVYYMLAEKMTNTFKDFDLNIIVDTPQYLPLPRSAKCDTLFYSKFYESTPSEKLYGLSDVFYDYQLSLNKTLTVSNSSFKIATIYKDISMLNVDFWLKDLDKTLIKHYIVADLSTMIMIDGCPDIISNLKNGTAESPIYPLHLFINEKKEVDQDQDISFFEDEELLFILNTVGGKIASCLNYADMKNNHYYFLKLMEYPNKSFTYSFHVVVVFCCLYKNFKQTEIIDAKEYQNALIKFKTASLKLYPGNSTLNSIFDALLTFNVLPYFESLYSPHIGKILNFIINSIKIVKPAAALSAICGSDDIKLQYTIELLKNSFSVLKINGILHYWDGCVYIKIKDKDSPFYMKLNNWLIDIKQGVQFDNKNYYKKIENTFLSTIEDSVSVPNLYRFFVNTKQGIFNSLCGIYMEPIPSLVFTKVKDRCIDSEFSSSLHFITEIENRNLENEIKKIIMTTGLVSMSQLFCDDVMFNFILRYIHENLNIMSESDLFYVLNRLVVLYNINTRCVEKIYDSLTILNNEKSITVSTENILKVHQQFYKNTKNESPTLEIDVSNFDSMNFNKVIIKLYFYSYVLCVLFLNHTNEITQKAIDYFGIKQNTYTQQQINSKMFQTIAKEKYHFSSKNIDDNPIYNKLKTIITPREAKLATFLFPLFNFDSLILVEFLISCSVLYQPHNDNKKFMLCVGPPNSGKSLLCSLLEHANKGNTFKKISAFPKNKNGQGPDPNIIPIYEHALTILSEVISIDANQIKAITGGDSSHLRSLYENSQRLYSPVCLVVGATNNTININVDEAIRTRLAPFPFTSKFDKCNNFDNIFSYLVKNRLPGVTFNLNELALEFNNLLYATYLKFRDVDGNVYSIIKNTKSKVLIKNILTKNSDIYKFLFHNELDFSPIAIIKCSDLKILYDDYIETHPEFKMSFDNLVFTMISNFNVERIDEVLNGVGKVKKQKETSSLIKYIITPKPGNLLHLTKVKTIINNKKSFEKFKFDYKDNIRGGLVIDLDITTESC